jgi:methyl-accepting chemotaxis protein
MSLLSNFTIRTKLVSMVAVSAVAVCAVIAVAASLSQKRMMEDRILQLRTAVDLVTGLAQSLQDEVEAGKMKLPKPKISFACAAGACCSTRDRATCSPIAPTPP